MYEKNYNSWFTVEALPKDVIEEWRLPDPPELNTCRSFLHYNTPPLEFGNVIIFNGFLRPQETATAMGNPPSSCNKIEGVRKYIIMSNIPWHFVSALPPSPSDNMPTTGPRNSLRNIVRGSRNIEVVISCGPDCVVGSCCGSSLRIFPVVLIDQLIEQSFITTMMLLLVSWGRRANENLGNH